MSHNELARAVLAVCDDLATTRAKNADIRFGADAVITRVRAAVAAHLAEHSTPPDSTPEEGQR